MRVVLFAAALASRHCVTRPKANATVAAFYAEGRNHGALPKHSWPNARPPAVDAVNLLGDYLEFDDSTLPPLFYVQAIEDNIVGFYAYNGAASVNITLLESLPPQDEFYVALHELLHWAGFGNLHGSPDRERVVANWHREFRGGNDPTFGKHWETVDGAHTRLGLPATSELMTARLTGRLFLSGTTLMACTRNTIAANGACIDSSDCGGGDCTFGADVFPGTCGSRAPHRSDNNVFLAVLVPILFILFAVSITELE